uniref:Uncharacterized protein n=1 Tax=Marseillevirus LCMAC101 TaxID=2506602 RepID=A0A481YST1_9VIRU|nr:MAG: hypothetical protein LCMAC101_07240 [Marseillevirus LCMAC101]
MYVTIDCRGDNSEWKTHDISDVHEEKENLCGEDGCGKWDAGSEEYSKDGNMLSENKFGGYQNLGDKDKAVQIFGFCNRALNVKRAAK